MSFPSLSVGEVCRVNSVEPSPSRGLVLPSCPLVFKAQCPHFLLLLARFFAAFSVLDLLSALYGLRSGNSANIGRIMSSCTAARALLTSKAYALSSCESAVARRSSTVSPIKEHAFASFGTIRSATSRRTLQTPIAVERESRNIVRAFSPRQPLMRVAAHS